MGGKHCCVVGCTNHSVKTGGNVSYFSFPVAAADADWRRALIVKVNRCDSGFNPKSQHICSAHFDPKCLLFHGNGYKLSKGSLPTLNMPSKSVETPCPLPRKEPFLQGEFLGYFQQWLQTTQTRPGFTKAERGKMFLSYQTYEGLVMTVKAFVECSRFLLQNGVSYILSQDFCQDPLEEHFGRHRGLGYRHENPNILQFGYQENQLRLQRNLAFAFNPKGNTAGRNGEKRPVTVSNSPLKKRKTPLNNIQLTINLTV